MPFLRRREVYVDRWFVPLRVCGRVCVCEWFLFTLKPLRFLHEHSLYMRMYIRLHEHSIHAYVYTYYIHTYTPTNVIRGARIMVFFPAVFWDLAGSTVCRSCDPGKYKASAGVNSACDMCEAGKYKASEGVNTACDNCEAGKYKASAGVNTACDMCEAGKYTAATSSTICTNCEAGKYSARMASTVCTNCEAGKYSARMASTVCTNCEAGKNKASEGVNTACDIIVASSQASTANVRIAVFLGIVQALYFCAFQIYELNSLP